MNKIIITGRLTRDPELKTANSGTELCNFTVAVERQWGGKDGEEQVDFIDCTAWKRDAVFVNKYFHKGDGITVDGRLQSRKWQDRDGNKRISWEIQCDHVEFPIKPPKDREGSGETYHQASNGALDVNPPMHELGDEEGGELPF